MERIWKEGVLFLGMVLGLVLLASSIAVAATTERVSVASDGAEGNNWSIGSDMDASGRFIVFTSNATNLVPNDANGFQDVFLHDQQTGATEMVSVSTEGYQGNGNSGYPSNSSFDERVSISSDGRYVVFLSLANNLAPGAPGVTYWKNVYIRDTELKTTKLVNKSMLGEVPNGGCQWAEISGDGKNVVFQSDANNLTIDDTSNSGDIFVYDVSGESVKLVSTSINGEVSKWQDHKPTINHNGEFVMFITASDNLVVDDVNNFPDLFLKNVVTGEITIISKNVSGEHFDALVDNAVFSMDGNFVAFTTEATNVTFDDTNGERDVFVYDLRTGSIEIASVNSDGVQVAPGGKWTGIGWPAISADGRYVAFGSEATNLIPYDTNGTYSDIFVHDRQTGKTEVVSVNTQGAQQMHYTRRPNISADGRYVVFGSLGRAMVPNDTNNQNDIFLHDRSEDNDGDGYLSFVDDCNDEDISVYVGATETKFDGIDQDCNGYDLSIDIAAAYQENKDRLTVNASSDLGAAADLALEGYGPMTYSGNKWSIIIEQAGGNPGSVTVSGVEGRETATVK